MVGDCAFKDIAICKPINTSYAFITTPFSVQLITVCIIESPFPVLEFSNTVNNLCFEAFPCFSDVFVSILILDGGLFRLDRLGQRVGSYEQ